jgi:hypothetical protein
MSTSTQEVESLVPVIAEILHDLLGVDGHALVKLLKFRVPCNDRMREELGPFCLVEDGIPQLTFLGLVNALFATEHGFVAAEQFQLPGGGWVVGRIAAVVGKIHDGQIEGDVFELPFTDRGSDLDSNGGVEIPG